MVTIFFSISTGINILKKDFRKSHKPLNLKEFYVFINAGKGKQA